MENHQVIKESNKKGRKKKGNYSRTTMNATALLSPYLSKITLNANGLNYPIKRHRVPG